MAEILLAAVEDVFGEVREGCIGVSAVVAAEFGDDV